MSVPGPAASTAFNKSHLALPVLLLFCGYLFFCGLGDRDLLSSHEARAAQNGQMILDEGCWGLPRLFDGHLELQKPPLYYWLVALLGKLAGGQVGAWAVRLPAALSALGCVLFVYYFARKVGRAGAGCVAAIVLASCLHFTSLARIGRIDMPLTLAVSLAAGSFFVGLHTSTVNPARSAWPWFLLGYISIAVGILLKGPIALVFVMAIVATWAVVRRRLGRDEVNLPPASGLGRSLCWGIPLVILVAAPWFVWANIETNNQIWDIFFWYHNVERGLGGAETLAAHPFWFYGPRSALDLLPWSPLLLPALWYFWRSTDWRGDSLACFGGLWFLVVFGILSCMRFKRADYLLPAYPGAALFLGSVAERAWQARRLAAPASARALLRVGAMVLTAYSLGWGLYNFWVVPRQEADWPYYQLARDIRAHTDKPVIFFRAETHVLAFHVGRPLDTILEWENLDVWASQPFPVYFVMPPDRARDWPRHLAKGKLEEVFRTSDHAWGKQERPLVVLRSYP